MREEVTFGSWLRQRRRELNITQTELAEQLNISWITLRKLESDERHPSGQVALLLAEHLRVPVDERQAFMAFARLGRPASGDANPSAPWRSSLARQTNLPIMLTPLIGRDKELAAALDLLLNRNTRMVTLIGAPGIGKTRLALQVALNSLANFEDGVYFVDLAPVMDPEAVLPTVARTLGLAETGEQSLQSLLLTYLQQKRMLLMLDNFEQVLDASTEVVKLMETSPWLKVLVTSREALQVRGERRFLVPPLAVPDPHHIPVLDELARYASVELFIERAQAVAPDFSLIDANAPDVGALCVGLEGLPLAIEIAASRASQLSLAEMRAGLASRFKLLKVETRDLPVRQRTLRGAIEWSYSLLGNEEQTFFRKLGVFVGGFTPDAVDAVCRSADGDGEASIAVTLGVLHSLVDKSLLKKEGSQRAEGIIDSLGGAGRQTRFGMLEAIREYVREKLQESGQPGEAQDVEREHALYFTRLAEEAEPHLRGHKQKEWLDMLADEYDNIRTALRWASERAEAEARVKQTDEGEDEGDVGLRIAGAIWRFWLMRGLFTEGREHLQRSLSIPTIPASAESEAIAQEHLKSTPSPIRRRGRTNALIGAGVLAYQQGDFSAARTQAQAALVLGREIGDKQSMAYALQTLGIVVVEQEGFLAARALFEESLALRRELGDKFGIAGSLQNLGIILMHGWGDYPAARALFEESLALRRELGDKLGIGTSLSMLGNLTFDEGNYPVARALYEESLALSREIGEKQGVAFTLNVLGSLALEQKDDPDYPNYPAARALFEESLALRRELGDKNGSALCLHNIGLVAREQGDFPEARALHEESLALYREIGEKWGTALSLGGLASVAREQGDYPAARALYEESLALYRETGSKMGIVETLAGVAGVNTGETVGVRPEVQEVERGAKLLGAVDGLLQSIGTTLSYPERAPYERSIQQARAQLGEAAFQKAWEEGHALSMEEAIAYAVDEA